MSDVGGPAETLAPVRLVEASRFRVGGDGEEYISAWLELHGRALAASQFQITPAEFDALNEALGGLPPRSRRGLRRWMADRIPPDVVTVRDQQGREWFRLNPGESKWSRIDYRNSLDEGALVYEAGPVVEVPNVTYSIPGGERDFVRTER